MPKTYHLELSPAAERDLKRLPRFIQKEKAFINEPKEKRSNVKSVGLTFLLARSCQIGVLDVCCLLTTQIMSIVSKFEHSPKFRR